MLLKTIGVGLLSTNCYIIGEQGGEALLIDPGGGEGKIIDCLNENHFAVKYIFLTHGHFDHVGALAATAQYTNAPIVVHKDDLPLLKGREAGLLAKDGQKLVVADEEFTIIHTPGHTPGSCCLLGNGMLFSGDTLFFETIGRHEPADVPNMERSLARLMELEDGVQVYPGHMRSTTIGHERTSNPYIKR